MHKIEQDMLAAIDACREWQKDNTRVNPVVGYIEVQLHGNTIATIDDYGTKPVLETFKRWPTATTCSRLRALGIGAHTKKGQPCIDGEPV